MNMLARPSLPVIVVIVAGMSLDLARVRADELPTDTNKIKSLTPEQARKLAREFPGVEVKARTGEGNFSQWSHGLPLQALTSLDPKTAQELAQFDGQVILLTGLTTFDIDIAKSFAAFGGDVVVQEAVRKTFCKKHPLAPETALGWAIAASDELSRVPVLDVATAKALAESDRPFLELNGLPTIDADAANALADFKGYSLWLNGLTTLDADTAKALGEFGGVLVLPDKVREVFLFKNPLTPETALAWAAVSKGSLSQITALDSPDSLAIAQALATRKGPLSLPNLKKISPKTLTALLNKEDVEIPLIETLELIQEPDGSVTEDFIIPERRNTR